MRNIYKIMCNILILANDRKNKFLIYLFTTEVLIKCCKSNLSLYRYFPKFTVYLLQISLDQWGGWGGLKKNALTLKTVYPVLPLPLELGGKDYFLLLLNESVFTYSLVTDRSHIFL